MKAANGIGQRVKNFRKAKGLTQQELEFEIGAACGHISRIESGQINPTKETLIKIAEALKLDSKEARFLIDFHTQKVSPQEITEVAKYVSPYLEESENPVYLADDMWFIHGWNSKVQYILGVPEEKASFLRGIHALELFFNPEIPLRNQMSSDAWEDFVLDQLSYFINYLGCKYRKEEEWFKKLIGDLERLPDFKRLWKQAFDTSRDFLPWKERFLVFKVNGKDVKFYISILNVDRFPRFYLIELVPKKVSDE